MIDRDEVQELDRLERKICRGIGSFARRNELIIKLVADGWSQVGITRRLNRIRVGLGVDPLTPDAIAATIKRQKKRQAST